MTSMFRGAAQSAINFGEMVIDNFAGGGGASTGIEIAPSRPKVFPQEEICRYLRPRGACLT